MSKLRTLAERLLRDRTRLPAEFGKAPIIVSSAGGLHQFVKQMDEVDPDLFATIRALARPNNTVWDIGANVGVFSVAAAAVIGGRGSVIAFQPDTSLVALLRRSERPSRRCCGTNTGRDLRRCRHHSDQVVGDFGAH